MPIIRRPAASSASNQERARSGAPIAGQITRVPDITGAFIDFGRAPAISDRGEIAFEGTTPDLALAFDSALNNRGQLAFIVGLADGRTGIYRADPIRGHHDHTDQRREWE